MNAEVGADRDIHLNNLVPKPCLGPAAEVAVNGFPGNARDVQSTPGAACLEHVQNTCDDQLQITERPTWSKPGLPILLVFKNLWIL